MSWFVRFLGAAKFAGYASLVGAAIGIVVAFLNASSWGRNRFGEAIAIHAFGGAFMAAALPAAVAAWYLLLHMLSQVARALRDRD